MQLFISSLEQGLIFAILAMGLVMTFKILNIADMTVEGSYPLGALFTAFLLLHGVHPIFASLLAFSIGLLPGVFSALLSIKLKISSLLAGILTMTMMYSVNLHINGRPNVPFTKSSTVFHLFETGKDNVDRILVLLILVICLKVLLDWFFSTKKGYMLIATGDNESLVLSLGSNPNEYRILGLALANGLAALSGSLFAQASKFADSQMGIGTLVIALASLIIGDTLFKNSKVKYTTRAIIGALIYKFIGGLAVELGLNPMDLKLINGLIVILFIYYNNIVPKVRKKLVKEENRVSTQEY